MGVDESLRRSYISQQGSGYADCVPIAICNALRFLGRRTPRPNTKRWEKVVDIAGCRFGGATSPHKVASFLGAKLVRISRKNIGIHVPVLLTAYNPEVGCSLHAVAVLDADAEGSTVVNYRVNAGPLIERVPWGDKPPLLYSDKRRIRRIRRDGTIQRVTVDFGPFDRREPWGVIYPYGTAYKVALGAR